VIDPSKPEGSSTRLKLTSVVRLHKLATIHQGSIARRLGSLSANRATEVSKKLRDLLNL
jgi:mRNA-degrading endonuclease toxin of MazEF toxin-antitoxin module